MIIKINQSQLPECLNIMKEGFEAIALMFGMTEENSPYRGRTRLPIEELEKQFLSGYQMYGYFYDDKIVGFLSLFIEEEQIQIQDIVILPEYQNNGFGSTFMQFAKEKARENKCEKIMLNTIIDNIQLKNWYERHGFKVIKLRNFDSVTYTVATMELNLTEE